MTEQPTEAPPAVDALHATDADLVRGARAGQAAAFEALARRHYPMVFAIAYARLGAREAAEDLVQEVFLLATLHLGALTDPARFAAWLGRIARNEAGMWRRRSQSASRLVRLVPLDDLPAEPADPAARQARTVLEADEETRALRQALFDLPDDQRELVMLHYFEGLSNAEIAERLEVHRATVARQIEKALKAMKRTLEPILRRAAPAFRHSGQAAARTTLLVGAVAAMSAPAKAALLAEAGASAAALAAVAGTTASVATTAIGWHTILTGGFIMSAKTQIAAVLIALALIAGVTYHEMAQPASTSKGPAAAVPQGTVTSKEQAVTPAPAPSPAAATSAAAASAVDDDLVLRPGTGIGAVHFGMTEEQVIAAWGAPDTNANRWLLYSKRGVKVGCSPTRGVVSFFLNIGRGTGEAFAGATTSGITFGMTEDEVIAKAGAPNRREQVGDVITLHYPGGLLVGLPGGFKAEWKNVPHVSDFIMEMQDQTSPEPIGITKPAPTSKVH